MPTLELEASSTSPRRARAFVEEWLERWGYAEFQADAVLVTSELTTNALLHAGDSFEVSIEEGEGTVRICVRDHSPSLPAVRRADGMANSGRGLPIVEAVSAAWGVISIPDDGKQIWATFGPRG